MNNAIDDQTIRFFSSEDNDAELPAATVVGEKGRNLIQVAQLGAPVPPGLVLPSGLCALMSDSNGELPPSVQKNLLRSIARLEEHTGRRFGDDGAPLLLTLRSSPPQAMPATLDAVVNLGLTEAGAGALAEALGDDRAAWDAYRRLIESYGVHVLGVEPAGFEQLMTEALEEGSAEADHELSGGALEGLAKQFRSHCEQETGASWPADPLEQLSRAIVAGYRAWEHPQALAYRSEEDLDSLPGTALVLQTMASGTARERSGAGSILSRVPSTGEKKPHGHFLATAMGSDLTAGIRMTDKVEALAETMPEAYRELLAWTDKLERHFRDAQEVRFAIDRERLWLLDSRPAPRTAKASLRIALELEAEGICDDRQALLLLDPTVIDAYQYPVLDKTDAPPALGKGLPASPGSAVGQVVFFAEHAAELAGQGIKTILIRHETTPEDIDGLKVAEGIVTSHGGLTSHAAVVARGMGKCCIVGAGGIHIDYLLNEMSLGDTCVKRLDWISIDGNTGEIYLGRLPQVPPVLEGGIAKVLAWADAHRTLGVYANADTAEDARHAIEQGAGGIGLCRTEHMFFEIDRIPVFRKMILALDEVGRSAALAELQPMQRKDFMDIFRVMDGRPVTIRLLDPPLNEFLPKGIRSQTRMSRVMGIPVETIQQRTESLTENNPMMGHRGCRLAITYPEIYNMQVRAIVEAACIVIKEGVSVTPEIMVPLVSTWRELKMLREQIEQLIAQVCEELGESVPFKIGTMIETPRAAMCSRAIARYADFYSFGTNDLTQMAYGFSRDDVGMFLPMYLEKEILDIDPFIRLDQEGTGQLVRIAAEEGRKVHPGMKLGICGEHGGDARSIKFFHEVGLDYVSCSPFRIPGARLAAGQAAVQEQDR